jgi:beta-glucosidase
VKRFATINEPSVFTLFSYGFGNDPPGAIDHAAHLLAIHHVNLAHGAAVDVLRAGIPDALIGAIHNVQPCVPSTPADADAAVRFDAYWNQAFTHPQCLGTYPAELVEEIEPYAQPGDLARICRQIDWFGLNHYSPIFAKSEPHSPLGFALGQVPPELKRSGIGWPIDPDLFCDTLIDVTRRYRLPIYVTENGYGASEELSAAGKLVDLGRIDYLRSHTDAMRDAIAKGADVRGYFVWSLLDNFEWGSGYNSRFGLVYVDYPTQRRVPKESFAWYADLIRRARQTGPRGEQHARGPEA